MTRRNLLAGACVGALAFTAGFAAARPSGQPKVDEALRLVSADGAHVVCLSAGPCLAPEAAHTLFVFVSGDDCAGALYDTAVLDPLFRGTPREKLNVVGVVRGMSRDEARAFADASGITYPLYLDADRLERLVGNPRKPGGNRPMKVLVDRRGTVVRVWHAAAEMRKQRDDLRRLTAEVGA